MKNFLQLLFIGIIFLFASISAKAQTEGELTFKFTQVQPVTVTKNVLAVWIENSSGTFVRTKMRYWRAGTTDDHLPTWKAKSGQNIVDASTGATLTSSSTPTAFGAKTVKWDGKTGALTALTTVPDGTYKVFVESAWSNSAPDNQHQDIQSYTFTKGPAADHVVGTNTTNFTNITLDWVPSTPIPTYTVTVSANPPAAAATVTGGGTFNQNTSCMVSFTANPDYTFINWTGDTNPSTSPAYSFTLTANISLVANFSYTPNAILETKTNNISVFPNPTNGIFNIKTDNLTNLIIRDITGKIVLQTNSKVVDLTNYTSGLYFVQIFADGNIYNTKIIKN